MHALGYAIKDGDWHS